MEHLSNDHEDHPNQHCCHKSLLLLQGCHMFQLCNCNTNFNFNQEHQHKHQEAIHPNH